MAFKRLAHLEVIGQFFLVLIIETFQHFRLPIDICFAYLLVLRHTGVSPFAFICSIMMFFNTGFDGTDGLPNINSIVRAVTF